VLIVAQISPIHYSQLAAKGIDHFADGVEAWFSPFAKGFIQAGSGDSGLPGDLSHSFGSGYRVQGMNKLFRGSGGGVLQKKMDVLIGLQVFGWVE
jgi:hypothetical protein